MYDRLALELAAKRHGVVGVHELRAAGMTPTDLRQLRSSRHWEQVTDAVLRRRGTTPTDAQRLVIAVLDAGREAALSHLSAARAWGAAGCPPEPVHVVKATQSTRRSTKGVVHRVRRLPVEWVTELDAIPIVRPELCALQLFAICRYERAERLVERMWSDRLLSGRSLRRLLRSIGRRGMNGTAGLRRYVDARPGAYVPAASGIEARTEQLLRDAGIEVRRQVDLGSADRWCGRVDFLVVGHPVVIEVQSSRHHTALTDRAADEVRRAGLEAAGIRVVEVWDTEVWTAPQVVVDRVRRAINAPFRVARK
ncbi:MAG: endonuclease domain-containing protein [Microthrixaceae bacterium]